MHKRSLSATNILLFALALLFLLKYLWVVFFRFNYTAVLTKKDDLYKENARLKQVLKENEYQESIISKIFKRVTNNHSLPQSQQQTQATDRAAIEHKSNIVYQM